MRPAEAPTARSPWWHVGTAAGPEPIGESDMEYGRAVEADPGRTPCFGLVARGTVIPPVDAGWAQALEG